MGGLHVFYRIKTIQSLGRHEPLRVQELTIPIDSKKVQMPKYIYFEYSAFIESYFCCHGSSGFVMSLYVTLGYLIGCT